jgi:hypothetical protein
MTKTPKTDTEARLTTIDCDDSCVEIYIKRDGKNVEGDIVIADFARQLEEKNNDLLQAMHEAIISLAYAEARFAGMALRLHPNDPDNDLVLESIGEAVKKLQPFLQ